MRFSDSYLSQMTVADTSSQMLHADVIMVADDVSRVADIDINQLQEVPDRPTKPSGAIELKNCCFDAQPAPIK
jgi:hypothetical protein